MKTNMKTLGVLLTSFALSVAACGGAATEAPLADTPTDVPATAVPEPMPAAPITNLTEGCVSDYNADTDYFPEKATLDYTNGFTIEYFNHYKVLTVATPWYGAETPLEYVLVQCGTPHPQGYADDQIIEVPVQTVVSTSTTYLPAIEKLGLTDYLVGLDSFGFVYNPVVRELIDAGGLAEVGGGANTNVEVLIDLDPELIITYGIGSPDSDAHPKLIEAGLPVVLNADYLDTSPLGRAEWLKFIGLFFNREATGEIIFDDIATQYSDLKALAAAADTRPSILSSNPWFDSWYIPGGNSYLAQLYADAGGDYLWADDQSSGSFPIDFEAVYERAVDADYWLSIDTAWFSIDDALAADERFGDFSALQTGNAYNYGARMNESGGNDYFEGGVANPHILLADMIKILHPELLPDHELVYHLQVAP